MRYICEIGDSLEIKCYVRLNKCANSTTYSLLESSISKVNETWSKLSKMLNFSKWSIMTHQLTRVNN